MAGNCQGKQGMAVTPDVKLSSSAVLSSHRALLNGPLRAIDHCRIAQKDREEAGCELLSSCNSLC